MKIGDLVKNKKNGAIHIITDRMPPVWIKLDDDSVYRAAGGVDGVRGRSWTDAAWKRIGQGWLHRNDFEMVSKS